MNKVVLFRLVRNDLIEGAVLVEKKVGVPITQYTRTFRGEHEKLVTSVWHEKGPTLVLSAVLKSPIGCYLLLSALIEFARYVFITFWIELVGRMVSHGWQSLHNSRLRGCLDRRSLRGRLPWQ